MSKNEQPDGESGEEPGKEENDESHLQGITFYYTCGFILIYIYCLSPQFKYNCGNRYGHFFH